MALHRIFHPSAGEVVTAFDPDHESPELAEVTDMAANIDTLADDLAERFDLTPGQAEGIAKWHTHQVQLEASRELAFFLSRIVGGLLFCANAKLRAAGLAFATNLASLHGFRSMRDYADKNALSVEAVSQATKFWKAELHIKHSPHSKSDEARASYRKAATENHWRHRKFKACTSTPPTSTPPCAAGPDATPSAA